MRYGDLFQALLQRQDAEIRRLSGNAEQFGQTSQSAEAENLIRAMNEFGDREDVYKSWIQIGTKRIDPLMMDLPFALIYSRTLEQAVASGSLVVPIPQQYSHLLILTTCKSSRADYWDSLLVNFNGDAGANYRLLYLEQAATIVTGFQTAPASALTLARCSGTSADPNSATGSFSFIPHYRSAFWKQIYSFGGEENHNGTDLVLHTFNGYWKSTVPINTIHFGLTTGPNFTAGSIFSIYGLL